MSGSPPPLLGSPVSQSVSQLSFAGLSLRSLSNPPPPSVRVATSSILILYFRPSNTQLAFVRLLNSLSKMGVLIHCPECPDLMVPNRHLPILLYAPPPQRGSSDKRAGKLRMRLRRGKERERERREGESERAPQLQFRRRFQRERACSISSSSSSLLYVHKRGFRQTVRNGVCGRKGTNEYESDGVRVYKRGK